MLSTLEYIFGFLPDRMVMICTILSFLIPLTVYKANKKLHEHGDPPWKKKGS
ncbi:hypothetical protein GCM10008924_23900 [Gracilibacillus halotolerans]